MLGPTDIPTERESEHCLLLPSRFSTNIWLKEGRYFQKGFGCVRAPSLILSLGAVELALLGAFVFCACLWI